MKPLERILAAVGNQPVDRTPCVPVLLQQGARLLGMSLTDYFRDPTRLADGQVATVERFDGDAVFAFPHIVQDTLPWGATLDFHEDGPPSVSKMAIERYEEIAELPVPDPTAHPYLRRTLEAASTLAKRYKGERLIVGAVIGPFSLPTLLMGTGKFLALVKRHPEYRELYLEKLMDRMCEYAIRWGNAQLEAGCDMVVMAEGIASSTVISEATFAEHALPHMRRVLEGIDGLTGLEMVGDSLPFARHLRDLPAVAYLVGEGDNLPTMRRALGDKDALMGNLNNLKMLHWGPERIEFEARRMVRDAGAGFILANQGPEIPWHVPDANIDALLRAVA